MSKEKEVKNQTEENQETPVEEEHSGEESEKKEVKKMSLKRKLAIGGGVLGGIVAAIGLGTIFKQRRDIADLEDYITEMSSDEESDEETQDDDPADVSADIDPGI